VAIAVQRTPLEILCLYLSCTITKLKTAVRTDKNSSDRSPIFFATYQIGWNQLWRSRSRGRCLKKCACICPVPERSSSLWSGLIQIRLLWPSTGSARTDSGDSGPEDRRLNLEPETRDDRRSRHRRVVFSDPWPLSGTGSLSGRDSAGLRVIQGPVDRDCQP
jgi:hypothetical protein